MKQQSSSAPSIPLPLHSSKPFQVKNFNGEHSCTATDVVQPKSVEELRTIVLQAKKSGTPTRACGSLNSMTACAMVQDNNGIVIDMKHMRKIVIHEKERLVDVQAGVSLGDLCSALEEYKYQLPCTPEHAFYNVVACCCTQVMDSSCRGISQFASQCVAYKAVLYDDNATLKVIDSSDADDLTYWRSNYGNMGIVYEVSLQLIPTINREKNTLLAQRVNHQLMNLSSFRNDFNRIVQDHDYMFAILDPYSSQKKPQDLSETQVYLQTRDYVDVKSNHSNIINSGSGWDQYRSSWPFGEVTKFPLTKKFPIRAVTSSSSIVQMSKIHEYYISSNSRPLPMRFKQNMQICDVAFPVSKFWNALDSTLYLLYSYQEKSNFRLAGGIVLQFLPKDTKQILSRSYDEDAISMNLYHHDYNDNAYNSFRLEFLKNSLTKYGGRLSFCNSGGISSEIMQFAFLNYDPNLLNLWKQRSNPKLLNPFFKYLFASNVVTAAPVSATMASSAAAGLSSQVAQEDNSSNEIKQEPIISKATTTTAPMVTATPPVTPSNSIEKEKKQNEVELMLKDQSFFMKFSTTIVQKSKLRD